MKSSKTYKKWVAIPQNQGDVTTEDLAMLINAGTTFTEGEVRGIVMSLLEQMRRALQDGHTVVLEGIGRFHLSVECEPVDSPEEFNVQQHVKRAKCKFVEAGKRRLDRTLERPLSSNVKYTLQPEYYTDEEQGMAFKKRGKLR